MVSTDQVFSFTRKFFLLKPQNVRSYKKSYYKKSVTDLANDDDALLAAFFFIKKETRIFSDKTLTLLSFVLKVLKLSRNGIKVNARSPTVSL